MTPTIFLSQAAPVRRSEPERLAKETRDLTRRQASDLWKAAIRVLSEEGR